MANGGLVGPVKVVCTSTTKTTSFTSSGTFKKTNCTTTTEVLVVAGGGGGGVDCAGGGGGAGGYRSGCVSLPASPMTVTIGGGGAGEQVPSSNTGRPATPGCQGSNQQSH